MSFYVVDRIRFLADGKYEFQEVTQRQAREWLNTKRPWAIDIENEDTRSEIFTMLVEQPEKAPNIPKLLQLGADDEALLVFEQPPKEHKAEGPGVTRVARHYRFGVIRGVK